MPKRTPLKRSLGLGMITFYGLGTIVGGGFYALIGKVSAEAGMLTPLAFLAAALIALFSALSFAELSARFPYSAGESHYVLVAFRKNWLSATTGWLVITTGVVSAATLADAFAGFLQSFVELPEPWIVAVMVIALGLVAAWGIGESAALAIVITLIEVGGLLFVLFVAGHRLADIPDRWQSLLPSFSPADWSGIFLGAYIAFYSFVGFEDMVNVAEEVKRPQRNLPIAILLSLALTAVLYFCVTLVTVLAVPQQELVKSATPLSLTVSSRTAAVAITIIGMLAGVNGALVQIIMASRVAYGMALKRQAPPIFSQVHPATQTPVRATLAATACVLILAWWFPIVTLAKATSTILLLVYAVVNLALWRVKWRLRPPPQEGPNYPVWLPITGFCLCTAFLAFQALQLLF